MSAASRLWPALLFGVAALLILAGVAQAGPRRLRGPVYIPPILHQDSQQPDKLLSRAFREAVALRVPVTADWRLTAPDPAVCRRGCVVVRIAGRRGPSPQYRLQLRAFPQGRQLASTQITGPSDTTPALLADALLLKTSFLLRLDLSRTHRPRKAAPAVVVTPQPPKARVHRHRPRPRFELGISGASLLVGLGHTMLAGGAELSAAMRLVGPFHLKAATGILGLGQVDDQHVNFQVFSAHVLAGLQWSWHRFQLGVYAGASLLIFMVEFDQFALDLMQSAVFTGLSPGPTAELHLAVRLHRYVSLGLTIRTIYAPVSLESTVSSQQTSATFRVPPVLLQSSLDVTFTF